jgi:hypothetical protein
MKNKCGVKLVSSALTLGLAMSMNASAYTLVPGDNGLSIELKGDYEVQLRQRTGDNKNLALEYDDLEIKVHAAQKIGNGMSIFGAVETDFKSEGEGSAKKTLDQAWVGIDFGALSLGLGRTDYATDNFSVEADYEMGPGDGFDQFSDAGGDLIFGNYKTENFKLYFSTDIAEGDDGEVKDESSVDLVAQFKVANLNLAIGYQDYKEDGSSESVDTIGARVKTKVGGLGFGLAFTTNDTRDQIDASLKYKLGGKLSGASGLSQVSPEGGEDITYWYSNIGRSYGKAKVFAEIGGDSRDDTKFGYLAGLRIRF